MTPDRDTGAHNEEWWASFEGYIDSMLEHASGCERVHPKIANWLKDILNGSPSVDSAFGPVIVQKYEELKEKLPPGMGNVDKRMRMCLLAGRSLAGSIENDNGEVKQAIACLATEVLLVTWGDIKDEPLGLTIGDLAEITCGEENGSLSIGVMIVGWAFQESLEAGKLDDL